MADVLCFWLDDLVAQGQLERNGASFSRLMRRACLYFAVQTKTPHWFPAMIMVFGSDFSDHFDEDVTLNHALPVDITHMSEEDIVSQIKDYELYMVGSPGFEENHSCLTRARYWEDTEIKTSPAEVALIQVYIDFENLTVPVRYFGDYMRAIKSFAVRSYGQHPLQWFVLLSNETIAQQLKDYQVTICHHPRSKKKNSTDKFMIKNMTNRATAAHTSRLRPGLVVVTGDRDFCSHMVELAGKGIPVSLVHNRFTWDTFAHNAWFAHTIEFDQLPGVDAIISAREEKRKQKNSQSPKKRIKSKYCRFFNSPTPCTEGARCTFRHACSLCDSDAHGRHVHDP